MKILLLAVLIVSSVRDVTSHYPRFLDPEKVTISVSDLVPTMLELDTKPKRYITANAITIEFSKNLFGDPKHPEESDVKDAAKLGNQLMAAFEKEDLVAEAQIVILDNKLFLITDQNQRPGVQVRWIIETIQRIYNIKLVSKTDTLEAFTRASIFFIMPIEKPILRLSPQWRRKNAQNKNEPVEPAAALRKRVKSS